jgi:hypothetical protein
MEIEINKHILQFIWDKAKRKLIQFNIIRKKKMANKLKVTIKNITVNNNGEPIGKGELYWRFDVDGAMLVEQSIDQARKTNDGEVIVVNEPRIVSKVGNDILDIFGTISEKDSLSKDENVYFRHQYTEADGWGRGTHDVNRKYGKLDVTVHYEIANA